MSTASAAEHVEATIDYVNLQPIITALCVRVDQGRVTPEAIRSISLRDVLRRHPDILPRLQEWEMLVKGRPAPSAGHEAHLRWVANVYRATKRAGVTMDELSDTLGVTQRTVMRWSAAAQTAGYLTAEDRAWV